MPFITDPSWSPTSYRAALSAWRANAPSKDSKVFSRKATSEKPRHSALSKKLRSLLTWKAMHRGDDWTVAAEQDNYAPIVDTTHEIRPLESEIMAGLKGVEFADRRHAKLGGGGALNIVPIGGDIVRGKVERQKRRKRPIPECVVKLGKVHFSNGGKEERVLIRDAVGRLTIGPVRIPLGGLIKIGRYRAVEYYEAENDKNPAATVGKCPTAHAAQMDFVDPIAEAQHTLFVRKAVGAETAAILDRAICAANFSDIGTDLGFIDKTAERQGKIAVIRACEVLDAVLAA